MLNIILRRRLLIGSAALLVALSVFAAWQAGITAAAIACVGGLVILTLVLGVRRELVLRQVLAEHELLRMRLALAERRLAVLAIKIDATEELDALKS